MIVSLLYFDDCPNWRQTDMDLTALANELGFTVERVVVETPEEATALGFRGSPTVLIDRRDPFVTGDEPLGLSCRMYLSEHGLMGHPSADDLRDAITRAIAQAHEVTAILKVTSVPSTLAWYEAAGFTIRGQHPDDGPTWAEVSRGPLVLQFVSGETPWSDPPTLTGSFYVHTDSVDRVLCDIAPAIEAPWGIERRPWGALELTLRDPDGYHVTFTQSQS